MSEYVDPFTGATITTTWNPITSSFETTPPAAGSSVGLYSIANSIAPYQSPSSLQEVVDTQGNLIMSETTVAQDQAAALASATSTSSSYVDQLIDGTQNFLGNAWDGIKSEFDWLGEKRETATNNLLSWINLESYKNLLGGGNTSSTAAPAPSSTYSSPVNAQQILLIGGAMVGAYLLFKNRKKKVRG